MAAPRSRSGLVLADGEPFFLPGGPTACLLVHGFTAMPAEMRDLGEHLAGLGHTVLAVRLTGHGTHPKDLSRTRWTDWLASVEDGLALLRPTADAIVLVGQSLGAVVALTSAARHPVAGVVAMSTPLGFPRSRARRWLDARDPRLWRKPVAPDPELGLRREADYPAYAAFPPRIVNEIELLHRELHRSLPAIRGRVLVIQSDADPLVPAEHGERLYALLPDADRRILRVHGLGHSVVLDPGRAVVFDAVGGFVAEISEAPSPSSRITASRTPPR